MELSAETSTSSPPCGEVCADAVSGGGLSGKAASPTTAAGGAKPVQLAQGSSALCWGAMLSGSSQHCTSAFPESGPHVRRKHCMNCNADGVIVPTSRLRVLRPDQHNDFMNEPMEGLWTFSHNGLPGFRVINQTRNCSGARLIVFSEDLPAPLCSSRHISRQSRVGRLPYSHCNGFLRFRLCDLFRYFEREHNAWLLEVTFGLLIKRSNVRT